MMHNLLIAQFPKDVADIIIGYAEVFKHPVENGFCAVCRVPYNWYTNLCNLHHNLCVLCLCEAEVDSNYVCEQCRRKYHTQKWMFYVMASTNGDIFTEMYKND